MDMINVERAILSTFLFCNDLGDDLNKVYKLDLSVFSTEFNKRVAKRINEVADGAYGYLSHTLEESIRGTVYENDWILILSQNSLGLGYSKKYHDSMLADKKRRLVI